MPFVATFRKERRMKLQMTLKTLLLCLALGSLTACSSSGKLVVTQAPSEPIAHDKTAALSVEPDVPEPKPSGGPPFTTKKRKIPKR